jgi:DNA-binding transcriptional LysR family regulator
MDMRWLQDFLTVAELGNFTRAAEERNTSQAAFSRRIQSLETWLGVTLIDRNVFPTRLTPEGERFKEHAADILRQLLDARTDLTGGPVLRRDQVRIALPHALAAGRLPGWWANWSSGRALSCQIIPGNVHDTVTMLVSGTVDLLISFHHAQQPIDLDDEHYERLVIGTERLRPYAASQHRQRWRLPGDAADPLPLLMYSPRAYLGRMVDLIIEGAPQTLIGPRILESDMADVLATMAAAGYGVAWLPDCAAAGMEAQLFPLDDDKWTMTISLVAYRDRANNSSALRRLWASLVSDRDEQQTNGAVKVSGRKAQR